LTEKLGRAAWTLFQEIEAVGGAPAALEKGLIQDKVAKVRAAHEAATATRKDALTGTSEFPNLAEAPVQVLDLKPVPLGAPVANITYPALKPIRFAEPFERLRDASDTMLAKTGTRPKVFLANLGTIAEFTARASFAKTFFEAGGIEAAANDGFPNREAMVTAFKTSGAKLACLCSADAVYEREAIDAAKALQAAGATHIYLAGRPKDADALKAAGVGTFIFAGGDAVTTLKAAHDTLATESKR
jgi:methylmalonyl-CoA mutase